jgi:hypothetical protein
MHHTHQVAKSPACANIVLEYRITARGVEEVEGAPIPQEMRQLGSVVGMAITSDMDFGMVV